MDYKVCKSNFSKTIGLMFSKKKNLLFEFDKEQRIPLHNLFVFYTISDSWWVLIPAFILGVASAHNGKKFKDAED